MAVPAGYELNYILLPPGNNYGYPASGLAAQENTGYLPGTNPAAEPGINHTLAADSLYPTVVGICD